MDPLTLDRAERWVAEVRAYWGERFDTLADYLKELQETNEP